MGLRDQGKGHGEAPGSWVGTVMATTCRAWVVRDALKSLVPYGNAQDTSNLNLNPPSVFMWLLLTVVSFLFYSSPSLASSCVRLGCRLWDTEHLPSDCFGLEDE